jgi:hypothetical protein
MKALYDAAWDKAIGGGNQEQGNLQKALFRHKLVSWNARRLK